REARLRAGPWARSERTTWILGPGLASCETYRVPLGGGDGVGWAIASVFTEPALRGHGFASALLDRLAERLRTEPGARGLVLFSDVGARIYERVGFVARPAVDRVWPADPGDPDDGPWTRITDAELPATLAATARPPGAAIWPSAGQLDWQLDRARTRAEVGRRRVVRPSRCGAVLDDGLAVWADDGDALLVLLLTGTRPETVDGLATAAARTAGSVGLRQVRAWDTPGPWPSWAPSRPRDGAIPMIRAFGDVPDWTWIPRGVWV
ncbi:MAG: GNAT family N-acetyltransferase, partial [Myxococcota bacterium]